MEKLKEEYLYDRDGNTEIRNEHNTTLYTPPSGSLFASLNHNKAEPSIWGPQNMWCYTQWHCITRHTGVSTIITLIPLPTVIIQENTTTPLPKRQTEHSRIQLLILRVSFLKFAQNLSELW